MSAGLEERRLQPLSKAGRNEVLDQILQLIREAPGWQRMQLEEGSAAGVQGLEGSLGPCAEG